MNQYRRPEQLGVVRKERWEEFVKAAEAKRFIYQAEHTKGAHYVFAKQNKGAIRNLIYDVNGKITLTAQELEHLKRSQTRQETEYRRYMR